MKRAPIVVLFIALFLVAATPRPITVYQGETLTLTANTGSRSATDVVAAEFSIPRTEVNYYVSGSGSDGATLRQRATFDIPPGDYEMRVRTWVNNELTNYDNIPVNVLPRGGTSTGTSGQSNQNTTVPGTSTIHIDPIPDVTPGTTLIVPVRITGNGDYTVEVPRLSFGTYEVPDNVHVEGTQSIPVLLHIDEDAKPGVYAVPIRVGAEEATARLRIIRYQEPAKMGIWWFLIPLGIILIIAGVLLLLSRRSPPRRIEPVPPPGSDDTELITYY